MKKATFIILLLLHSVLFKGAILSTNSEFSLLTCSEGTDVYSLFGHTAIRVNNAETKEDYVFNYGLFNFSSKHFIWKFVKGETYYMLGVQSYESFMFSYQVEERSVWEQKLNLTPDEKHKLIKILATDYKPENRTYLYNFLYNNCATKVRDDLEKTFEIHTYKDTAAPLTFRDILQPYLKHATWTRFGINLALGQPLENIITQREKLFLPLELMDAYKEKGYAITTLYQAEPQNSKTSFLTPAQVFIALLIILLIRFFKAKELKNWPLIIALFITGTGGLILSFISFFSIHPAVFPNYNILILQPLNILGAFYLIFFKKARIFSDLYFIYYLIALLIILIVKQATTLPIILLTLNVITLLATYIKINRVNNHH
ncbi:DUF4105 domain-containing protein [Saccharicrinis sp. FJH2]|uniref:Lnb N-terminal periplasmic domain-containing protein n=1 Tax=Saccharicrinis sp. FJH65 TaxID=3344659 RepID=UPI0035F40F50